MIVGNVVKMGYGSVAVGSAMDKLTFKYIKPPQEVGAKVDLRKGDVEVVGYELRVSVDLDDIRYLQEKCAKVADRTITMFEYKGIVLDYSNYNPKSIDVLLEHLEGIFNYHISLMAC